MKVKIAITTTSFAKLDEQPLLLLSDSRFDVVLNSYGRKLSRDEVVELAADAVGLIAGTEQLDISVLEKLPKLKCISRLGVGMDNIDIDVAKQKGIKLYKTQTTPAPAVAELALGLMIDSARKISNQNSDLKSGTWQKKMGNILQGKTLGIVGLGTIGKTLVKLVKGFNFKILGYDLYQDEHFKTKYGVTYCDLDTLLAKSDIVSIHLNLSDETNQLMNEEQISKMKPDSILINTSRGEIIDEEALFNALKDKKILGAGLDVFNDEPYSGPLKKLNNIILTPHIGSYAKELRIQMEIETVENLLRGLNE